MVKPDCGGSIFLFRRIAQSRSERRSLSGRIQSEHRAREDSIPRPAATNGPLRKGPRQR